MNMKFKFIIVSLLTLFSIGSCQTHQEKAIVLSPTKDDIIQCGTIDKTIMLEETDDSRLSEISKSFIDFKEEKIFVLSNFNLFVFNLKGRFLFKLKTGRGPDEINMAMSFSVDDVNKKIYVLDRLQAIYIYDYNGILDRKYKYDNLSATDIQVIDSINVLLYNPLIHYDKYFVGIYNLVKGKITKEYVSTAESPYPEFNYITQNNFSTYKEKIYFTSPNIFSLFKYDQDTITKVCEYDLANMTVPTSFAEKYKEGGRLIFREEAIRNGYVPFILSTFYFNEFYFVILTDENTSCYVVSKAGDVYFQGGIQSYFGLPDAYSLRYPIGYSDDKIIFSCSPLDFFEYDENTGSKEIEIGNTRMNISYDSNPFLIIIK